MNESLSPPRGWKKLQALAQKARDSNELALILDQLNLLLAKQEQKRASEKNESLP